MKNEPRMVFDPFKNLGVLVAAQLSTTTCTVFFLATLGIDDVEEADELLMAMALHTLADDLAVKHIERREKGGDAVPLIVVGDGAGTSLLHR